MIDFTNCKIDLLANYGGSDQKRGIIYQNKRYMLKMSDRIDTGNQMELNSSYSNSAFSEYICCHILNALGFSAQNTLLGQLTITSSKGEQKTVPVVACENFIPADCEMVDFKMICNAVLLDKPGRTPKIKELYEIFTHENSYFDKELGNRALEKYWEQFILDAFLGNFDRHGNNFAYFINKNTQELIFTPIYDCGSCLYPQIADEGIVFVLNSPEEIEKRISKFPNAALENDNKEKVNYQKFIHSLENEDCNKALLNVFPKLDFKIINKIIDSTVELTEIKKTFYKTMLKERYEKILVPAYERLQSRQQQEEQNLTSDEWLDID